MRPLATPIAVLGLLAALAALGGLGCAAPKRELAPRAERSLFRGMWHATFAAAAEERCWRGFPTAGGTPAPDPVPFHLSIGPGGEVTRVEPDLGALAGAELPAGFAECLTQIIRGMRFPASGEAYLTQVQAERPRRPASAPAP